MPSSPVNLGPTSGPSWRGPCPATGAPAVATRPAPPTRWRRDPARRADELARRLAAYDDAARDVAPMLDRFEVRYVARPAGQGPPSGAGWSLLQDGPTWAIWERPTLPGGRVAGPRSGGRGDGHGAGPGAEAADQPPRGDGSGGVGSSRRGGTNGGDGGSEASTG